VKIQCRLVKPLPRPLSCGATVYTQISVRERLISGKIFTFAKDNRCKKNNKTYLSLIYYQTSDWKKEGIYSEVHNIQLKSSYAQDR